jgi:hypothetical protein
LSELLVTASDATCKGVDFATVASLAKKLHSNPLYASQAIYNLFYYKTLAYIAWERGDYDATIEHSRQASAHGQRADINVMMVMAMAANGEFDAARDFIDKTRALGPVNPVKAAMWQRDLDSLSEYVRKLKESGQPAPRG